MQRIVLVDNGSRRAGAVLNLYRIAGELSQKSGRPIDAAPLQHADKISAEAFGDELGGRPVLTFPDYVAGILANGVDEIIILPLFFGHSRAISSFIPDTLESLEIAHGKFNCRIADVLCPLPRGEPKLARLLYENLGLLSDPPPGKPGFVILTDHGSPSRKVNAVRVRLAEQLAPYLPQQVSLLQAAMERREGAEYDFNGPLLQDLLEKLARENGAAEVVISMLFLSPGRHAGDGGDISEICDRVMQRYPGFTVRISPLVGDNRLLIDILYDRLQAVMVSG